jgi:hypothetical protein
MRDGKIEGGRRYKTISERGGGEGREDTDISCIFPTEHKTNKTKQIKTKQNKTKQNKIKQNKTDRQNFRSYQSLVDSALGSRSRPSRACTQHHTEVIQHQGCVLF